MLHAMQQRTYDTGKPESPGYAVIRIPKSLKRDLERLAVHDTQQLIDNVAELDQTYGVATIERRRLALWVPLSKLVRREVERRQKLKSWKAGE